MNFFNMCIHLLHFSKVLSNHKGFCFFGFFFFTILVVFLRDSNYANVRSPFPDVFICHFSLCSFITFSFLFAYFYSFCPLRPWLCFPCGHSVLCSFQLHIFISFFPESCQPIVYHSSYQSLTSFIFPLHSDCPFWKGSQQSISYHLLLGKIFQVGICPLLLISFNFDFLSFFAGFLNSGYAIFQNYFSLNELNFPSPATSFAPTTKADCFLQIWLIWIILVCVAPSLLLWIKLGLKGFCHQLQPVSKVSISTVVNKGYNIYISWWNLTFRNCILKLLWKFSNTHKSKENR